MKGRIIALLSLALTAGPAAACSYIVQTQVRFERGSAELDRSQVIKLAEWLDRSYTDFSMYTGAAVEAGASGPVDADAKALAALRATNTVKALRMLLRADLPVEKFSRAYRFSTSDLGENNDFASLQLYPDAARLKLPDCNPVPIPGFKY